MGQGSRKERNTHYRVGSGESLQDESSRLDSVEWARLLNPFLAGVMRFLQTEWHRHERDRNAWQIERAEMKSRIGKLEGDGRTNKRLRESLDKHVRILEYALKKERAKLKALAEENPEGNPEKKTEIQDTKQAVKPDSKRWLSRACPYLRLTINSPASETSQFFSRPGKRRL